MNGLLKLKLKLKNVKVISFADDTVITFSQKTWAKALSIAESDLVTINQWLDTNTLSLNINKTKYMTFSANAIGQPNEELSLK